MKFKELFKYTFINEFDLDPSYNINLKLFNQQK